MSRPAPILALLFVAVTVLGAQRGAGDDRAAMLQSIDAKRDGYAAVARQIWSFAEVGYQERWMSR